MYKEFQKSSNLLLYFLKNHFVIGKSLVKLLLNIYTHMNMCVYIHAYILLNCLNSQAMLDTY